MQQQRKLFFDLGIPGVIAPRRIGHRQMIDEVTRFVSFRRQLRIIERADREPVAADGGHKKWRPCGARLRKGPNLVAGGSDFRALHQPGIVAGGGHFGRLHQLHVGMTSCSHFRDFNDLHA